VVRDGQIFSGGGVTAGIDMALRVAAEIAGAAHAQAIELALEYAPEAPFACGRPEMAAAETVSAVRARLGLAQRRAAAERAARALTRDFARAGSV
jgi:cyclohexyl-isocyanide hydratase